MNPLVTRSSAARLRRLAAWSRMVVTVLLLSLSLRVAAQPASSGPAPATSSGTARPASSGTASPASAFGDPRWPEVRGPFSWADRIMNSTVIARSGGIGLLRQRTAKLYTPDFRIVSYPVVPDGHDILPGQVLPGGGRFADGHVLPEPLSRHMGFFSYALGSGLYEDAAALLFADGLFAPSDTLSYLRGLTAYDIHDFALAADSFGSIPSASPYYPQARSFLDIWDATFDAARSYTLAGSAGTTGAAGMAGTASAMDKNRSPLLAGAMSAVIPGSGKIYAGDLRSGISTFLIVGALGGIAAESWIKLGGRDWRTIALSSVFGLFYIGNIYGSAVSVSVVKNTYEYAEKATLLFDLRIPLHQF